MYLVILNSIEKLVLISNNKIHNLYACAHLEYNAMDRAGCHTVRNKLVVLYKQIYILQRMTYQFGSVNQFIV